MKSTPDGKLPRVESVLRLLPCAESFSKVLGDMRLLYMSVFLLFTGLDDRDELLQFPKSFIMQPGECLSRLHKIQLLDTRKVLPDDERYDKQLEVAVFGHAASNRH